MKHPFSIPLCYAIGSALLLSACGVDTLGAAATTATLQAKSAEQATEQKKAIENQLSDSLAKTEDKAKAIEEATK
jgi:hypothetical protein